MTSAQDARLDGKRATVFLSYARPDQAQAAKLVSALEQAGLRVWWDALIGGGAAFSRAIAAGPNQPIDSAQRSGTRSIDEDARFWRAVAAARV